MPEELGKIEKPPIENFQGGRKLYFVPLIFSAKDLPAEFTDIYNRYWKQVESQIFNLEIKLGPIKHIFHELIPEGGQEGLKTLEQLGVNSSQVIRARVDSGTIFEATEDSEVLTELMDWSRCLSIGLQSQKVYSTIYNFYNESSQKRNEYISKKINDTIKENETAILFMGEGHHINFASDIQVFYVAPPALDELKRWIRDFEAKHKAEHPEGPHTHEDEEDGNPDNPISH